MLLNELFDTNVPISWKQDDYQHRGIFVLNGITYVIKIDEWQFQLPDTTGTNSTMFDYLDIGFTAGSSESSQSLEPTALYKAPSVLGAFINGIKPKVRQFHSDGILFGARKADPLFLSRMSAYERVADMYMKQLYPNKIYLETTVGKFVLLSKQQFSDNQIKFINNFVAMHFNDK